MTADLDIRALGPGDADWIVERLSVHAREEGFDDSFAPLIARIVGDFERDFDPAREAGWIAERAGRRLGCVFCVAEDDATARLRIMYLEPEARGLGLGSRLLGHCMAFARARGYRRMVLSTNDGRSAATGLYRRAGFTLAEEAPVRQFGLDVLEQHYEIAL